MLEIIALSASTDLEMVLIIVFFIWVLNWAKSNLENKVIAVIIAIVITYFTVWQHPEFAWIAALIVVLSSFGSEFTKNFQKRFKEVFMITKNK